MVNICNSLLCRNWSAHTPVCVTFGYDWLRGRFRMCSKISLDIASKNSEVGSNENYWCVLFLLLVKMIKQL